MSTPFQFFARYNGAPAIGFSPVFRALRYSPSGLDFNGGNYPVISELKIPGATGCGWYQFALDLGPGADDLLGVVDMGEAVASPKDRWVSVMASARMKPERQEGTLALISQYTGLVEQRTLSMLMYSIAFFATVADAPGRLFADWVGQQPAEQLYSQLNPDDYISGALSAVVVSGALAGQVFTVLYFSSVDGIQAAYAEPAAAGLQSGDRVLFCPSASGQIAATQGQRTSSGAVDLGPLQASINRVLGLVGHNQVSSDFVYDPAGMILSFTIRSYDTAANAEADDVLSGLLGQYSVTNTLNDDGLVESTTTTLDGSSA